MGEAGDYCSSHFQRAKYTRKPYVLVSTITKKSLQLWDGVKIKHLHIHHCLQEPIHYASAVHELKKVAADQWGDSDYALDCAIKKVQKAKSVEGIL